MTEAFRAAVAFLLIVHRSTHKTAACTTLYATHRTTPLGAEALSSGNSAKHTGQSARSPSRRGWGSSVGQIVRRLRPPCPGSRQGRARPGRKGLGLSASVLSSVRWFRAGKARMRCGPQVRAVCSGPPCSTTAGSELVQSIRIEA
ncbi:hypothetical protein NL108_007236 [Boleophthalmus pectinirostris]|nr:hypothetical protein NL108_007236 [Boleophthalmus pectinirostris]